MLAADSLGTSNSNIRNKTLEIVSFTSRRQGVNMNNEEFQELSTRAREDGRRLFAVTEMLHKIGLIAPATFGFLGMIAGVAAISNVGIFAGLIVFAVAGFITWLLYLGLVLTTSLSKVLVHSMFSVLATTEILRKNNLVEK